MDFAKFIHRQTSEEFYSPIEFIINLEFKNKRWL